VRAEKREVENEEILVKELKNGGTNCALIRNKSLYAETCWRLGLNRKRFLRRPTCIFSRFPFFSKARLGLLPFCVLCQLLNWHSFSNASITSICTKFRYHSCLFACFLVSGKVLIIVLAAAGIVVLITVFCCVYCCCCRRKRGNG